MRCFFSRKQPKIKEKREKEDESHGSKQGSNPHYRKGSGAAAPQPSRFASRCYLAMISSHRVNAKTQKYKILRMNLVNLKY